MAFYRGPQSPRDEQYTSNPLSPPQRNPNRWSASMAGTNDVRGSLHRRFTTNTVPQLSPIGQQRRQAAGDVQQSVSRAFLQSKQDGRAAQRADWARQELGICDVCPERAMHWKWAQAELVQRTAVSSTGWLFKDAGSVMDIRDRVQEEIRYVFRLRNWI